LETHKRNVPFKNLLHFKFWQNAFIFYFVFLSGIARQKSLSYACTYAWACARAHTQTSVHMCVIMYWNVYIYIYTIGYTFWESSYNTALKRKKYSAVSL
jgi:hypothetical protein